MLDQTKPVGLSDNLEQVFEDFVDVRTFSEKLCEPLKPEDYNLQAIAETSPAKWHLAHTSWFFETFILKSFYQTTHASTLSSNISSILITTLLESNIPDPRGDCYQSLMLK